MKPPKRLALSCDVEKQRSKALELVTIERLGQEIGHVIIGVDVLHVQLALKVQLTHLEVATIDVT